MALVTVGVPVYNGSNYLASALESLIGQTHADLEILVADNASTDDTEEIARRFAAQDSRIRYHRHEANRGAAANFNFTLTEAKGDYFMWSPHDDLRHPQFVEKALTGFQQQPPTSSVFSRSVSINSAGTERNPMRRPDELLSPDAAVRMRATIGCRHPGVIIFGLVRTDLLRRLGGQKDYPGGDRVLAVELSLHGPFLELPEVMFYNRDHPDRYVQMKTTHGAAGRMLQEGWWDPARLAHLTFPGWRRLGAYWQAIGQAPLSAAERRRCLLGLVAAIADHGGAIPRDMAKDLNVAFGRLIRTEVRRRPGGRR